MRPMHYWWGNGQVSFPIPRDSTPFEIDMIGQTSQGEDLRFLSVKDARGAHRPRFMGGRESGDLARFVDWIEVARTRRRRFDLVDTNPASHYITRSSNPVN